MAARGPLYRDSGENTSTGVSHVFNEEEEEEEDDDDDEGEDARPGPERVLQRTCSVAPRDPVRRSIEVK